MHMFIYIYIYIYIPYISYVLGGHPLADCIHDGMHATPTVCFQTLIWYDFKPKWHMVFCTGPIHDRRNSNQARACSLTEDKGVILPLKGISLLCQSFIMLCLTLLLIHLAVSMSSSSPDRSSSCVHDQSKFPMFDPHQTPPQASKVAQPAKR